MRLRRSALLIALYVALDFANPMMPGALVFGVEDSVEARHPDRSRADNDAPPFDAAPERVAAAEPVRVPSRMTLVSPRAPRTHVTRSRLSLPASASLEDH